MQDIESLSGETKTGRDLEVGREVSTCDTDTLSLLVGGSGVLSFSRLW